MGAEAEVIKADVLENGVDDRGVLTQAYGSDALDAALLLAPLMRFLPADDPRMRATVLAIADEFTLDGLVLRYRVDRDRRRPRRRGGDVRDLLVLVGVGSGRDRRARARPRPLRTHALVREPAGALRRGDRSAPGRHWGNFPQAFTHLAQINALMHVIRADASATGGAPSPLR